MPNEKFQLIAAPHTPFHPDGQLNVAAISKQTERLIADEVSGAFVCGSTGEGMSLTVEERQKVATEWSRCVGERLRLLVHVGHNCQTDAVCLAQHAAGLENVEAIAMFAPNYYRPANVDELIRFIKPVAEAGGKPFYFYDIPSMTGFEFRSSELIRRHNEIPFFRGIKFTNPSFVELQECLDLARDDFEILWGCDEILLSALPYGIRGAVGSSYNFAAPLYRKLIAAFTDRDLNRATDLQLLSARMISVIADSGYMGTAKRLMQRIGVDCGSVRPPLCGPDDATVEKVCNQLAELGLDYFTS